MDRTVPRVKPIFDVRDAPFIQAKQALNLLSDSLRAHHHCCPDCLPSDRCFMYLGSLYQFVEFSFYTEGMPR